MGSVTVRSSRDHFNVYLQDRFTYTGNPMYACEAYLEARSIGDPPPEWVLQWLDAGIGEFWSAYMQFFMQFATTGEAESHPADAFARGFSIAAPNGAGGQGNIWTKFFNSTIGVPWYALGKKVESILRDWSNQNGASKVSAAIAEAMHWYNELPGPKPGRSPSKVSLSTVWRAWHRYQREYPNRLSTVRLSATKRQRHLKIS